MENARRRVVVRGRVQGVGFRFTARDQAQRLGLAGYVRNLGDGAVEAEIEGRAEQLDAMVEWLKAGPRGARVASAEVTEMAPLGESNFDITG